MGKLQGKVAIITGASGGLGKQIALRFATEGAKLSICARNETRLQETVTLCEEAGAEVLSIPLDLCNYDELAAFVQATVDRFGTIDILVNNAVTISNPHPFVEHTLEELDATVRSGLYGTWSMMQLCFPYLKDKNASVINFGSGAGRAGHEGFAAYAAVKEAIRGLTRVTAREWGKYGIRVNTVCPSAITDNVKAGLEYLPPEMKEAVTNLMSINPLCLPGDPYEDITPVVLFMVCDESGWITGQDINVEGGGDIHS